MKGGIYVRVNLKNARLRLGLTHEQLAQKAGISRVHYTQIENATNTNNKSPSLDVALNLKKVLNYHNDDLFLISNVPIKNKK